MENILFLVLIAVVGLVRWLVQAAENKKNAEAAKTSNPSTVADARPASSAPPQSEEERIRKFLEALGVPTSSAPPPKVQPRESAAPVAPPQRRILPVDPFPLPRSVTAAPRPPIVIASPPLVVPPPSVAPPLPLPTRQPATLTSPATEFADRFEFGVRNIDDATAEDSISHSGRRVASAAGKSQPAQLGLGERLATAGGLRDAMVLREIFGPPRSMQALDRQTAG